MFVVGTNAWSAGYVCTESMTYTSCSNGYYVSDCGASSNWSGQTLTESDVNLGNTCESCPTGYTCTGGLVCPTKSSAQSGYLCDEVKRYVSCPAGEYLSDCGDSSNWVGQTLDKSELAIGNACVSCPDGYTCVGGATCPIIPDYKFELTTTADTNSFDITMNSVAGTFYIDWGDGVVEVQSREPGDSITAITWTHTYKETGEYTIKIGGLATKYGVGRYVGTIVFDSSAFIESIRGSLGAIFPTLDDGSQPVFINTFMNATSLTEVPGDLFSDVTGAPRPQMFSGTFSYSGLTQIPAELFSGISGAPAESMFENTFSGCTALESIPVGLFDGLDVTKPAACYMFSSTFESCTSLTGDAARMSDDKGGKYLHEIWPMGDSMAACPMMQTYTGTNIDDLAYIPTSWGGGGKIKIECPVGTYLPANDMTCTECPADAQYCPGGFIEFSETKASGLFDCPDGYTYNKEAGKSDARECQISCSGGYGYRIATPGASGCAYNTQGGWFTMSGVNVTNYGDVSSVYWCANGFDNNSSVYPGGHINADFACVNGTVAAANRGTNYAPDVMAIRVTNLGSDNTDALVVTEIGAFAWEADTYANNNNAKIFNYGDSILYNTNGLSTDGRGTGPEIGIENLDDASALGVVLDAGDEYTWDFSDPAQIGTIKISVMPIVADGYADNYANANFKIDVLVADTWYTVFDTSSRAYNDYGSTVGAHMPKTFNILPMMSTACPAGSYGNTSAVSGVIYSTINSSNVCTACAAGKYQDVQGQTSCKNCDSLLGIKAESAEGSASKEACYIPADNLADDGTGQYRYTNDCYYK